MKIRLIDADFLQETLAKESMNNRNYYRANEIVVNMPIAYDVDKVVNELKNGKFTEQETVLSDTRQGFNAGIEFSIKEVRGGGVDG